ncbi:MAG: hypothetical protein U0R68_02140 [Candidatus Nanopelagicales bacterium]
MRTRTHVRRLVAVVVSLLLVAAGTVVAAGPSAAVDGGLTFDEGYAADGARVDDQYRFVGGTTGIRFGGTRVDLGWPGETECGGSGTGDYRPTLRLLSGNGSFSFYAHSGARALESASNNCTAGEFGTGGILFRCTVACLSVSGFVGLGNQTATPPSPNAGTTFTASAYDATGAAVVSSPVVLDGPGALTGFSLAAPVGRSFTFVKIVATGAVQSVLLDDLTYTVDPSALPAYVISTDSTLAQLRPGESTTVPLSVVRANGSSGTITPTTSVLPSGVTASFSPSSFTGTDDGALALTLTASSSASPGDPVPLVVSATSEPGAGPGTPASLSLHVVSTLQPLGDIPTLLAPACTNQVRTLPVYVGDGSSFTGQVDVSVTVDQPTWQVGVVSSPLPVVNGRVSPAVWWRRGAPPAPSSATITVTASPVGRPLDSVSRTYAIAQKPPDLTVSSLSVQPPLGDRQPGDELALTGYGFCGAMKLRFGNDKAVVDTASVQAPIPSLPRDGTLNTQSISAAVPRLATSGVLSFDRLDGHGFLAGPALTVTGYRNTAGFRFDNYAVNDLTYQDMTDAFGADQTYSRIDLCFPFGCTITFRDPVAMIYTAIVRAQTVGTQGSGHCYGMAMTAALMRQGGVDPKQYLPYTSSTAWGLTGDAGPSPALAHTIQVNHLKQFGLTFMAYWLKQHQTNILANADFTAAAIRKAIDTQGGALVTIADHGGGHVVLAHSIEDGAPGEHWVDVYDPNYPYTKAEDLDTTGATHESRLTRSRIHLVGTTWSLQFPDGTVWQGNLNGLTSSLVVVPLSEAAKKQLLPSLFDVGQIISLLGSLMSFGSTGGKATVTAGPGLLAYPAINASTTSGLFLPAPTGPTTSSSAGSVHLAGTSAGTVDGLVVADGTTVASALGLRPGTDVTVQKVVGGQLVTTDTALPSTITTTRAGSTSLTSTLSYVAPAGSTVSVAQTTSGLSVRSTAPLALRIRVDNRSTRSAGVTRTIALALPARTTLAVPAAVLSGSASTVVATLNGRRVALAAPRVVAGTAAVKSVASTRTGSTLTVAASVAVKAKRGAKGTVILVLTRGGRIVATKRFAVTARAAALGTPVVYRWRLTASRGLVLRVTAVVAVPTSASGVVSATRGTVAR